MTIGVKMSKVAARKNRQAFLSYKGSFANAQNAAATIASARCAMTFQDVKNLSNDGKNNEGRTSSEEASKAVITAMQTSKNS